MGAVTLQRHKGRMMSTEGESHPSVWPCQPAQPRRPSLMLYLALFGHWNDICKLPSIPGKDNVEQKIGTCHQIVRAFIVASKSPMHKSIFFEAGTAVKDSGQKGDMSHSKVIWAIANVNCRCLGCSLTRTQGLRNGFGERAMILEGE